jgi:uncharacterized membrane protein
LILAGAFVAVGALMVALAIPLIRRRVGPNSLVGLRVSATFADEQVWYEANARSGRDLLWLGVLLILLALALPLLGVRDDEYVLTWIVAAVVGALAMGIRGWRYANRLRRERRSSSPSSGEGS